MEIFNDLFFKVDWFFRKKKIGVSFFLEKVSVYG